MDKTCILFTGLQASGKTTFYREQFPTLPHVNLDTLHTRNREKMLLEDCFGSGAAFVVDNTNPTRKDRERYIGPAKETDTGSSGTISSQPSPPVWRETGKEKEKLGFRRLL